MQLPYSPIIDRPDYSWLDGKRLPVYFGLNAEHFVARPGVELFTPKKRNPRVYRKRLMVEWLTL
jgi:hypothetical protein